MGRRVRRALIALGVLALVIQLVPVSRTDPPVVQMVTAPPVVERLLRRACFDCHSREPRRPWYAYVAPVSWLVAYDIAEARERLDFSDWGHAAEERDEIAEVVGEGEMPPWFYSMMSVDRHLTQADRAVLVQWAQGGSSQSDSQARTREGEEGNDDD